MRRIRLTGQLAEPISHYTDAVEAGGFLFVSGMLPVDARGELVGAGDVGRNDIITGMCDDRRYQLDYGVEGHRSCRSNFTEALAPWGIAEWQMPDPVNFFQNAPINPDRTFGNTVPTGKPGDKLMVRTLMDAIVAVSACPQDLNPCNGFNPSPLLIRVLDPDPDNP